MKHFYLMHGCMGECPDGDTTGEWVLASEAEQDTAKLREAVERIVACCDNTSRRVRFSKDGKPIYYYVVYIPDEDKIEWQALNNGEGG